MQIDKHYLVYNVHFMESILNAFVQNA